jgi:ankyrin repeat protein
MNVCAALMMACANGHTDCVVELLRAKADKFAVAKDGWNSILLASMYGHWKCMQLLIEAGVSPDFQVRIIQSMLWF